MKKKSIVFIKKQKKKYLAKKKKIVFKLNKQLEYLKILKLLSKNRILLFFQFTSLNSEKDEILFKKFIDEKIIHIYWLKKNLKNILSKKWYYYIRNFNNMLLLKNFEQLILSEKMLKEKKILILGYYFNKIFFYKKDLILSNMDLKKIIPFFLKRKKRIKNIYIKIIFSLKYNLKKIIWILNIKKKINGNN